MSRPSTPESNSDHAIAHYYSQFPQNQNTAKVFQNLDDPVAFDDFYKNLKVPKTRNFVLDFGGDHARAALDLDANDVLAVLKRPVRIQSNPKYHSFH